MGLKSIIKGVPSVFKGIGNTLDILGKTKEMKDNGRELVSYKNTYAAFNDVRQRTEKRIFIFSSLVSIIFLGFYGYLIYLNIDVYSLRHIIVYSVLSVLLITSLFFNIVLNPMRKKMMSTEQKIKRERNISIEKNIILLLTTLTKLVSLGYMLFEIITIDSSIKRLIPFALSTLALTVQILVNYISRLIVNYYKTILVGINEDIKASGIIETLTGKDIIKEQINVASGVDEKSAKQIKERLDNQIKVDNSVKEKNNKDLLFNISRYLVVNNPISLEDYKNKYKFSPTKEKDTLHHLTDLGIITIKSKKIEVQITDLNTIKDLIYKK